MNKKYLWHFFKKKGFTDYGIAGLLANIAVESGFNPKNLEGKGNNALRMTDEEYTKAVDSGTYSFEKFCKDTHGYGLAQWTYHTRKANLYNYAKKCKKSIGDLETQAEFLYNELKGYPAVFKVLQTATAAETAATVVMLQFERPYDQSKKAQDGRAALGKAIYYEFCKRVNIEMPTLLKGSNCNEVKTLQILLNGNGFDCGKADGDFGTNTEKAVKAFQKAKKAKGLAADGIAGKDTWTLLLS